MKLALCLGGGGSKGAFQAGAVEALSELGYQFDIVTGCSIGAFNGAMIAQGEFDRARDLWNEISIREIISHGIDFEPSVEAILEQREQIIPFLKNTLHSGVDISPLKELMREYIDSEKFFAGSIDFGAVTVSFPQLKPVYKTKADLTADNLHEWLLASATCFPAFPLCEIDGDYYVDGGYYDKLPIDLAFKMGADHVIAVDLNEEATHPHYQHHPCVTYITPSFDLGSFLSFQQDTIQQNIKMGYLDTMKKLGKLMGSCYSFYPPLDDKISRFAEKFCRSLVDLELPMGEENEPVVSKFASDYILSEKVVSKTDTSPLQTLINALEICMQSLAIDPFETYRIEDAIRMVCDGYLVDISLPGDNQETKRKLKSVTEDMLLAQLIKHTAKQMPI